jgi:2-hydroxychromene-2-carboxylate isomerase
MARLTFWYEFASTYSYLAAMRIDAAADAAGVEVAWQPFLLGPIFKAQGWTTSPFNIYPAKGRYMIRDVARIAAARGLPFRMPDPFPANTLKAARLAIVGIDAGWVAPF